MKIALALFLGLIMTSSLPAQQKTADVIFINGDIYGQHPYTAQATIKNGTLPPSKTSVHVPTATAIAVANGRIIQVGPKQEIEKLKGPNTQIVDLGGHFVMPGFNDAHTHLGSGGFEKLNVNLVGTKSLDEMKQRIAARAKTAAAGEWIVGRGWDHTLWNVQNTPTRQDIDA